MSINQVISRIRRNKIETTFWYIRKKASCNLVNNGLLKISDWKQMVCMFNSEFSFMARIILHLTELVCACSCSQAKNFLHRVMINILCSVHSRASSCMVTVFKLSFIQFTNLFSWGLSYSEYWLSKIGMMIQTAIWILKAKFSVCSYRLGTVEFFPVRSHLLHPSPHTRAHCSNTVRGMTNICHVQFFLCLCFLFPGVIFHIKLFFYRFKFISHLWSLLHRGSPG